MERCMFGRHAEKEQIINFRREVRGAAMAIYSTPYRC